MSELLSLTIMVDADRYRFSRLVMEAVVELGGNEFCAIARLNRFTESVRAGLQAGDSLLKGELRLEQDRLMACCSNGEAVLLCDVAIPGVNDVAALVKRLKQKSEQLDPDLLRQVNEHIVADLEAAKRKASEEMAELEAALENKKKELQATLRRAETDGLTGLLNRGAYEQRIRHSVSYCLRQNQPLSLLMIDMDDFKKINDEHGHQCGDQCLRQMAAVMQDKVRGSVDYACRIGGDEFAVVLFADMPIAERIGQSILTGMKRKVSIGVAELKARDTPDSLIARADSALYAAKNAGRGRVMVSTNPGIESPAQ